MGTYIRRIQFSNWHGLKIRSWGFNKKVWLSFWIQGIDKLSFNCKAIGNNILRINYKLQYILLNDKNLIKNDERHLNYSLIRIKLVRKSNLKKKWLDLIYFTLRYLK